MTQNQGQMAYHTPWVLNIGSGKWQMPFIRAWQELGVAVCAADRDASAEGMCIAEHAMVADCHRFESLLSAWQSLRTRRPEIAASLVGVVTTASRGCLENAGRLAQHLSVCGPGVPLQALPDLTQRDRFRDFSSRLGLPQPARQLVTRSDPPVHLSLPVVVKAVADTSGSSGHGLVRNHASWAQAVAAALGAQPQAGEGSRAEPAALAEQYIPGIDVGVLSLHHRGAPRAWATVERQVVDFPHFLPQRYVVPAVVEASVWQSLQEQQTALAQALGVTQGALYVEYRLAHDGTAYAIEAEPVVPAHVDRLISYAYATCVHTQVARLLLGENLHPTWRKASRSAGCAFVYASGPGVISEIATGGSRASTPMRQPTVDTDTDIETCKANASCVTNTSAADICAIVRAVGTSPGEVHDRLERQTAHVDVRLQAA